MPSSCSIWARARSQLLPSVWAYGRCWGGMSRTGWWIA
jgi:hypothetical protein